MEYTIISFAIIIAILSGFAPAPQDLKGFNLYMALSDIFSASAVFCILYFIKPLRQLAIRIPTSIVINGMFVFGAVILLLLICNIMSFFPAYIEEVRFEKRTELLAITVENIGYGSLEELQNVAETISVSKKYSKAKIEIRQGGEKLTESIEESLRQGKVRRERDPLGQTEDVFFSPNTFDGLQNFLNDKLLGAVLAIKIGTDINVCERLSQINKKYARALTQYTWLINEKIDTLSEQKKLIAFNFFDLMGAENVECVRTILYIKPKEEIPVVKFIQECIDDLGKATDKEIEEYAVEQGGDEAEIIKKYAFFVNYSLDMLI